VAEPGVPGAPAARGRLLRDGVTVGVLNPKRLLLLVALLPQFTTTDGAPASVQLLALGLLVVGAAVVCDAAWGLAAGVARGPLRDRRDVLERFGAVAGAVMVALGVRLALTI
jgi:threonine/homoserine/homoserine lactone efflux protein